MDDKTELLARKRKLRLVRRTRSSKKAKERMLARAKVQAMRKGRVDLARSSA